MEEPTEPMTVESAMQESASVFEGHPAKIDENPGKTPDEETKGKPEVEPDEKPEFKYESHEAAEKGSREAERLMHEKADEAKRERERSAELQSQLNTALLTKASVEPETPEENGADKMRVLLDRVEELDPDDEDYQEQVAALWGKREDELRGRIDTQVQEALEKYDEKVKENQSKVFEQKKIKSDAENAGIEAGLDMKEGSADSELFWVFADKAPEGSIEAQIKWTVGKTKGIKTAFAAPGIKEKEDNLEAKRKAKANQEQNSVLERAGEGRQPARVNPEVPLGLATAFRQIERRI